LVGVCIERRAEHLLHSLDERLIVQRRQVLGVNRELLKSGKRDVVSQRIARARKSARSEGEWIGLSLVRPEHVLNVAVPIEDDVGNASKSAILRLDPVVEQIAQLQRARACARLHRPCILRHVHNAARA